MLETKVTGGLGSRREAAERARRAWVAWREWGTKLLRDWLKSTVQALWMMWVRVVGRWARRAAGRPRVGAVKSLGRAMILGSWVWGERWGRRPACWREAWMRCRAVGGSAARTGQ
jgi:hypothetical protein